MQTLASEVAGIAFMLLLRRSNVGIRLAQGSCPPMPKLHCCETGLCRNTSREQICSRNELRHFVIEENTGLTWEDRQLTFFSTCKL